MSSVIKNMNHCEDPNQIQYAFVALRFYCSAVIIFRWLFQAMVRFFYFKDDFDILCKVKLIQLYNSLMRKKHTWMVHVVLFFKMSFGSAVVGGNDWSQEEMKGAKRRQEGIFKPIVHSAIYN